jgi:hypothetical protein
LLTGKIKIPEETKEAPMSPIIEQSAELSSSSVDSFDPRSQKLQ